jgi:hypothetical protein
MLRVTLGDVAAGLAPRASAVVGGVFGVTFGIVGPWSRSRGRPSAGRSRRPLGHGVKEASVTRKGRVEELDDLAVAGCVLPAPPAPGTDA